MKVDADLIQKTKDHGLVLSKSLENKLQEYFQFIDAVSNISNKDRRPGGDLTAHFTGKNILVSPKDTKILISYHI